MQFEPNVGQTDSQVQFISRGPGYTLFLTPTQAVLSLRSIKGSQAGARPRHGAHERGAPVNVNETVLRMALAGAHPHPQIEGISLLPGTVNYFVGNDPVHWQTGVPTFSEVKFHQVYPGIDLVYYGNHRQLEYDFVVSPIGDPSQISLAFTGPDRLEVDSQGDLIAHFSDGIVRWPKPVAYQQTGVGRKEIPITFVLQDEATVGFQVAAYESTSPLIIDPVLVYGTYLGGNASDYACGIAVNSSGNVYVAGNTLSLNFPTASAYGSSSVGLNDAYISKLNPAGTALVYSTYLGGSSNEITGGLAVDSSGNAYVAGVTDSLNFPTKNPAYSGNSGYKDAFIAKIGPFGTNLLYASYLGGGSDDSGNSIAVDNSGNAYIAGDTFSLGTGNGPFPTVPNNAYQTKNNGGPSGRDAFVARFDTTQSGSASLIYCTFLGGSLSDERAYAIAIDSSGNAYVTGEVVSYADYTVIPPTPPNSDFPLVNAFQSQFNNGYADPSFAGSYDGFVTEVNSTGTGLIFSTFLGGDFDDFGTGIGLDPSGRICVVGETYSTDFPTLNAAQPLNAGTATSPDFPGPDAFVTVFQPSGSSLYYSTYLGGSGTEDFGGYRFSIAADRFGDLYVTGWTDSSATPAPTDPTDPTVQFPITRNADQTNSIAQVGDAFVTKINPAVSGPAGIVYSTFFGGDVDTRGTSIAVDSNGNFYVAGFTSSTTNIATSGVFRGTNSGGFYDAFVAKFSSPPDLSVAMIPSIDPVVMGSNLTYSIYINNNGRSTFTGVTNVVLFPTNLPILSVSSSAGNWSTNAGRVTFNIGVMTNNAAITQTIVLRTQAAGVMTNTATLTSNETPAVEPNTGNNISTVVSTVQGIADVTLTASDAPDPVAVSSNLTYTFKVTNKGPSPATSVVLTDALPATLTFVSATSTQGACTTNADGTFTCSFGTVTNNTSATVTLVMMALTNGVVTNVLNVAAFEADFNMANNSASVTTTVSPLANLAVGLNGPATGYAGSNITYSLTVTNLGPSSANTVVLTDTLPAGASFVTATTSQGNYSQLNGVVTCNLGTVASNGVATATITTTPLVTGPNTNNASVSSAAIDSVATNNTASLITQVSPGADIGISHVASPSSAPVLSNVTFTITVTNRGPSTATSVVVTDSPPASFAFTYLSTNLPPGASSSFANGTLTFNLGDLANGASATVSLLVQARLDGTFTSTAGVSSTTYDLSPNNTAVGTVTITPNPNAPLLKITRSSPNVILSWANNATNFNLYSKPDVSTNGSWAMVTNSPRNSGGQYFVTNSATGGAKFYKLIK